MTSSRPPWAGQPNPRRSRTSWSTWPAMSPVTRPGRNSWSMAAPPQAWGTRTSLPSTPTRNRTGLPSGGYGLGFLGRLGIWIGPGRRDRALPDPLRPPEPLAQQRSNGRRHQRPDDQRVEEQAEADGGADLADDRQVADRHCHHREGEDESRRRDYRTRAAHGSDDAGVQPGVDLLLEPRDQ